MLREWFSEETNIFRPEDGEKILEASEFEPVVNGKLLTVQMRSEEENAKEISIDVALHSAVGQ